MAISWPRALAFRLRQHLLDPVGSGSAIDVVHRLGAVPAQSDAAAELAVRVRRARSRPGEIPRALAEGRLLKTFAFRGATFFVTPEDAADFLALRAAGRMWERRSWQTYYDLRPDDWPGLRAAVREALADGPLTRDEFAARVAAHARFRHLHGALTDSSATLLKPLAWLGELSFGPSRDGRATLQRLDTNPRWPGLPDLDAAGRRSVEGYVRGYGPVTPEQVQRWLGDGLGAGRKRIQGWLAALSDRLRTVDVDGASALVVAEHHDELLAARESSSVRLLPGHDQWVLGPGTDDPRLVPAQRRALVSRGANLVLDGGGVSGTWSVAAGRVVVDRFPELRSPPPGLLADEITRLEALVTGPASTSRR